jgi:cell surface protein SprA
LNHLDKSNGGGAPFLSDPGDDSTKVYPDHPVDSLKAPVKNDSAKVNLPAQQPVNVPVTVPNQDSLKKASEINVPGRENRDSVKRQPVVPADKHRSDSLKGIHLPDSLLKKGMDTLSGKDTVKIDPMTLDSTARLEYFHYQRNEDFYVKMFNKKNSKFFAQSKTYPKERKIELDSTGEYVIIREKTAGQETKIALRLKFDDYIAMRLNAHRRELWEDLGYKYELKKAEKDLGGLIKDFTDFEIPLPSVGVLSIFGTPKISLKIGGSVLIHGAWRNETTEGVTASRLGNTRNEPDFKQQVQINVNGTIGDKLQISADWNTERTFEYENMLKIKYTGYPDEIIQSIEAGNVSLQTSSLVGGGEALFGVKAGFKMGPLTLTTIASQKKGEIKEVSLSGGSSSQIFLKHAYEYSTNHFFVDDIYADPKVGIFANYYNGLHRTTNPDYQIIEIEVWKNITSPQPDYTREKECIALIDLPALPEGQSKYPDAIKTTPVSVGTVESSRFVRLTQGNDFTYDQYTGVINFQTSLNDDDIIAVAYKTSKGWVGEKVGNFNIADSLNRVVLKLVKPARLQPQYTKAWKLLLKNIYNIGASNIQKEGFKLDIKYVTESDSASEISGSYTKDGSSVRLLNSFGFDYTDASGGGTTPDGEFDFNEYTINTATGEIIFPTLEPFGTDLPAKLNDNLKFQVIYDTTQTAARNYKELDRFIITGKMTGSASSTFNIGYNIVENSVKVMLNGNQLVAGVDYVVDYNVGTITIRNNDALVANANLKITYEQNDLFQLASKTLVGARGIFDLSSKTKLGFSAMNLTQQTLSDKVRIGEEPLSNSIYGIDLQTSADLPFITKFLDNFISTKEKSSITFNGEFAYMRPDPNTKKSTVQSDNGLSIAYIDDFEGSKKLIPIGVSYTSWKDLSVPIGIDTRGGGTALEAMNKKGRFFWYNYIPSPIQVNQIWPKKKVAQGDEAVTVLDCEYRPSLPGMYNYNKGPLQYPDSSWGGLMKRLSTQNTNLVDENIEYIEFWYSSKSNFNQTDSLYIDLGLISEDVIPNGKLDKEDKNGNNAIDNMAEDTGIDGLSDAEEVERAKELGITETDSDPAHDNWFLVSGGKSPDDFLFANGTQGNSVSIEAGKYPDTEDLKNTNNLGQINSYFEYSVPLKADDQNPYVVSSEGQSGDWRLFRIPLKSFIAKYGNPSFSNIDMIRLYVKNIDKTVHFSLVEFNLVGNQWQKVVKDDSLMKITVVNIEDNPNYSSPPGVAREKDRSRPDQNIEKNEQSLNMQILSLPKNTKKEVFKSLYHPLDVFSYKEMKLFVHGDESSNATISNYISENNYAAEVYYRFGSDSNNYYEYRQPVQKGWNEISIKFADITSKKQGRDSTQIDSVLKFPLSDKPGHYYVIKGNPSLTKIGIMTIGVYNPGKSVGSDTIRGDIWINELRVIGADDSPGWAYTASTSIKFADLMNVNMNISRTDPNFHRLSDRFGSRIDQLSWGISADLDILKLFPGDNTGSNLKVSYSHTESIQKPKYMPGSDMLVSEAAAKTKAYYLDKGSTEQEANAIAENIITQTQSLQVSDSWNFASIKIKLPTDYWLIKHTFNSLTYGFNYNKTFSRNPSTLDSRTWVWNANLNYALNFEPNNFFYPADIPVFGTLLNLFTDYRNLKIYYSPQTFTADFTAKRSRSYNTPRTTGKVAASTNIARDFGTTRAFATNWKFTDGGFINLSASYNVNISSTLSFLETDQYNNQRSESSIWRDVFSGAFFGRDFQYDQNVELRTNPRLPSLWNIDKNFTLTFGYSTKYSWKTNFMQENLGRSAGYDSRFNAQLTLKLKDLTAPLFESGPASEQERIANLRQSQQQQMNPRGRGRGRETETDTAQAAANLPLPVTAPRNYITADSLYKTIPDTLFSYMPDTLKTKALDSLKLVLADSAKRMNERSAVLDSIAAIPKTPIYKTAFLMLKLFSKIAFFDYESIQVSFTNDNSFSASGLMAKGNGSLNFLGLTYKENNGPSRLFMLGLNNDIGKRMPGVSIGDNYSQRNNLELKTSKPLWEGARIDLNWKVGWTLQNSNNYTTDENGFILDKGLTKNATGSIDRSFLSLPPTLIFSFFKNGIKKVNELYQAKGGKGVASMQDLSDSFVEGFETMPLLSKFSFLKEFTKYIPRPNWRLQWDGLEALPLLKSVTKKVTLEHSYSSSYSEGWKLSTDNGAKEIQTQRVSYGFSPLVGLNLTFNSLWDGSFTGSIKYNTKTDYSLGLTTQNVSESVSKDIGISLNYSKTGFEIPLFGVSLKNDFEFSFSYTYGKNSNVSYDLGEFKEDGTPGDISTRISMEPRIKYVISSKVTLSVFYKRTTQQPEGVSQLPATTTNEMGLDVNISIQ